MYTPYNESMLRLPALSNSRSPVPVRITLKRVLAGTAAYSSGYLSWQSVGEEAHTTDTAG